MPLVPPLKPKASITSIVLIVYTETSLTPSKVLLRPLHHVLLVLGPLVEQEGDGGVRGWPWLSQNALWGVVTPALALYFRIWKWNFNPGMGMRGTGHPQVGGCDGGGGGQQPGWGGEGGLQALAAGKLAVWNQIQVSIRFGVFVQGGQEVRGA